MKVQKTATALNSLIFGLLIASLSQVAHGDEPVASLDQKKETKAENTSSYSDLPGVTEETIGTVKMVIRAKSVEAAKTLMSNTKSALAQRVSKEGESTQEKFHAISDTVKQALDAGDPNGETPAALELTQTEKKPEGKAVIGYVDLYQAYYWWNRVVGYLGTIYAYNRYVNVVTCFANNDYGTWRLAYQNDGVWYYPGYIYTGGQYAWTGYGYDSYKGCWWQGYEGANKGDFVLYFFN